MIKIMSRMLTDLFAAARCTELVAGQALFLTSQPVLNLFWVQSGRVHLCRHTVAGARLVLQNAGEGTVLAEASAYSDQYHCDAVAAEVSQVRALPKALFLDALSKDSMLSQNWAAKLARGIQAARVRAEIRTLPKVTDRLDAWLGECNRLPEKGQWQDVAAELGVTREALYRELARRREGSFGNPP